MNTVVGVLFAVLWVGLVFLLARELLDRVFSGRQRDFVAAGFAIALVLGAALPQRWVAVQRGPLADLGAPVDATAAAPVTAAAAPAPAATDAPLRDVSAACRTYTPGRAAAGQGSLDVVFTGAAALPAAAAASRRTALHFIGWSAADAHTRSTGVCLLVDGRVLRSAVSLYDGVRPDVAAAYADPALTDTGYEINVAPNAMPPNGKHVFSVVSLTPKGKGLRVPQPRTIVIKP